MKILRTSTVDEICQLVVDRLIDQTISKPCSVFGLATGNTMIPIYEAWVKKINDLNLDLSKSFFFLLDEYAGLSSNSPASFKSYIQSHFFSKLGITSHQYLIPSLDNMNNYDSLIEQAGGIDIQLLGIGKNGHIGFNEPGSDFNTKTRTVRLTEQTLISNEKNLGFEKPHEAVTMGVSTILESKKIFMIATGVEKSNVIKYLINHHMDTNCPATFLKDHESFFLFLDSEASSKINLNI
jgi:glucosamine-6-phosphate deaminase